MPDIWGDETGARESLSGIQGQSSGRPYVGGKSPKSYKLFCIFRA